MIVISDTSPIINLAMIGHLDLLPELYEKVYIPNSVFEEIVIEGAGKPGAEEIQQAEWIEKREVSNSLMVTTLQEELDKGEAEAIVLAVEIKADLLLMDERRGRRKASRFDIPCLGLLGMLIQAKNKGLISKAKPLMDNLIFKAGFRISEALYQRILEASQE